MLSEQSLENQNRCSSSSYSKLDTTSLPENTGDLENYMYLLSKYFTVIYY